MWTGTTTGGKVVYVEREELEKAYSELMQQNKHLLNKINEINKLDILIKKSHKIQCCLTQ